jgi:tetratricopeptide (TPR) repeat protein
MRSMIMSPLENFVFSLRGPDVPGAEILDDLRGDPAQVFVFRAYRMVGLWLATEDHLRPTLFHIEDLETLSLQIVEQADFCTGPEAENPSAGLVVLITEMVQPKPDLSGMALGALVVAEWAFGFDHIRTALAYSRLAAAVANNSRFAWLTARHLRTYGFSEESETWFHVAHAAATQEGDWDTKARAVMGLGVLSFNSGSYPQARQRFEFALRVATRYGVRARVGEIHHHLFTIGVAMTDHALAEREAHLVLDHYRHSHPRLPHFAHDLAAYWTGRGDYANALVLLRQLLSRNYFEHEPDAELLTFAWGARAAAGAGDVVCFTRFFAEARGRIAAAPSESLAVAQALLLLARGALSLERWVVARNCLVEALAEGERTGQGYVKIHGEELLANVDQRLRAEPRFLGSANAPVAKRAVTLLMRRAS